MVGYYHKFIPSYDDIAAPLTQLKREAFRWSPEVAAAFNSLKATLTTALVLQLPNFTKLFLINCDASGSAMGAVLHQGHRPIAFFSQAIAPQHAKLASYERKLIGLVKAMTSGCQRFHIIIGSASSSAISSRWSSSRGGSMSLLMHEDNLFQHGGRGGGGQPAVWAQAEEGSNSKWAQGQVS
jgi:hypothetical protein